MSLTLTVIDELDRAFQDSWPRANGPSEPIELMAARGGHVGTQLVVGAAGEAVNVRAGDLRRRRSGALPAPTVFHVRFVPLEKNTSYNDSFLPEGVFDMTTSDPTPKELRQLVRRAPCEIAEVLVPANEGISEDSRPVVLFIDYEIPRDASPGRYSHLVEVRSGSEQIELRIEVEVFAASLPESQQLRITNWFSLPEIASKHGVEMWDEEYWSLLRQYARIMKAHGQTMFWLQRQVFDLTVVDGEVGVDWGQVERYIKLFLDEGFTEIEGPHLSDRRSGADNVTHLTWATSLTQRKRRLGPVPTTMESHKLLRQWLTPLWDLVKTRRWDSRYYQHVFDEPLDEQAEHYRHLALIVRQLMPGVRLMDALHIHGLNGASDVMVPSYLGGVRRERKFAAEFQALGIEMWYYTCCCPRGRWLNRFLDFPLIRTRLLHWYNYITGTTGYLHWGLNQYRGMNPWKQTVIDAENHPDGVVVLPPGDTHVVWPGEGTAYGSLRFTAMRNGIEDYELLAMLRDEEGTRAKRADEIADLVIRNGTSYVQDPVRFTGLRRQLLELASS